MDKYGTRGGRHVPPTPWDKGRSPPDPSRTGGGVRPRWVAAAPLSRVASLRIYVDMYMDMEHEIWIWNMSMKNEYEIWIWNIDMNMNMNMKSEYEIWHMNMKNEYERWTMKYERWIWKMKMTNETWNMKHKKN